MTAKGMFELLRDHPDSVHVLEDVETLFSDKAAFGVLRSALWGQPREDGVQERPVVWQVGGVRDEFAFTGGLIMVSNRRLDDVPELRAVKTRVPCMHYAPTDDELAALIRSLASQGHRHGPYYLSPAECEEVAREVIERCLRLQRRLDLRIYVNGCLDRLQWAAGAASTHWLDLLDGRLKERIQGRDGQRLSRAARKESEQELVRRIFGLPPQERLIAWKAATGKSKAALYRRLSEVNGLIVSERPGGTLPPVA